MVPRKYMLFSGRMGAGLILFFFSFYFPPLPRISCSFQGGALYVCMFVCMYALAFIHVTEGGFWKPDERCSFVSLVRLRYSSGVKVEKKWYPRGVSIWQQKQQYVGCRPLLSYGREGAFCFFFLPFLLIYLPSAPAYRQRQFRPDPAAFVVCVFLFRFSQCPVIPSIGPQSRFGDKRLKNRSSLSPKRDCSPTI